MNIFIELSCPKFTVFEPRPPECVKLCERHTDCTGNSVCCAVNTCSTECMTRGRRHFFFPKLHVLPECKNRLTILLLFIYNWSVRVFFDFQHTHVLQYVVLLPVHVFTCTMMTDVWRVSVRRSDRDVRYVSGLLDFEYNSERRTEMVVRNAIAPKYQERAPTW